MGVFKCLRPRIITNKVGERVTVSCGHCAACLSMKSSNLAKLCVLESESNLFTTFVTLTYRQEELPVCSVRTYGESTYFVAETLRIKGKIESDCVGVLNHPKNLSSLDYIFSKVYNPDAITSFGYSEGFIPFVSRVDAQNFMKRLRYYIYSFCQKNKLQYEKIRYFICAEYGPEHFRPHFHILLFYNSAWLREELPGFLYQAWTFGNIDYSQVQNHGGCASYVASYCNSVAYLPEIYQSKGLRPFVLHSTGFGQKPFRQQFTEILEGKSSDSPRSSVQFGDRIREVFAPLSLSSTLLPRCFHYVQSNDYVRYLLLSLFGRVVQKYDVKEPSAPLVASIVNYVDPSFKYELEEAFCFSLSEENVTSIVQSSYNYYRLKLDYPCVDIRRRIDDYYSDYNLRRLSRFYSSQQEFLDTYGFGSREYLVHYYDNVYVSGMSVNDAHSLSLSDIERSKRFYDSISVAWEFVEFSDINYVLNPEFCKFSHLSNHIFKSKSKEKKYNDKFKSKVLNY